MNFEYNLGNDRKKSEPGLASASIKYVNSNSGTGTNGNSADKPRNTAPFTTNANTMLNSQYINPVAA